MPSERYFVDTCVFVACGRQNNPKFQALRREAEQEDIEFWIPPRVGDELSGDPSIDAYRSGGVPIDEAIEQGWVRVSDPPDYRSSVVSNVMDETRRFIATKTGRDEDLVEKADTAIAGLAVQALNERVVDSIVVITGDLALGGAIEVLIPRHGYDTDQIKWINGNRFVDNLL